MVEDSGGVTRIAAAHKYCFALLAKQNCCSLNEQVGHLILCPWDSIVVRVISSSSSWSRSTVNFLPLPLASDNFRKQPDPLAALQVEGRDRFSFTSTPVTREEVWESFPLLSRILNVHAWYVELLQGSLTPRRSGKYLAETASYNKNGNHFLLLLQADICLWKCRSDFFIRFSRTKCRLSRWEWTTFYTSFSQGRIN